MNAPSMRSPRSKVMSTFGLCGLMSGIAAFIYLKGPGVLANPQPRPLLPWIIDGAIFLLALTLALWICQARKWIGIRAAPGRYVTAAALVLGVPFVGLLIGSFAGISSLLVLGVVIPHPTETTRRFGFAVALALVVNGGTVCASTCMLQAVRLLGARAGRVGFTVFFLSAVVLGVVTSVVLLTSLHRDPASTGYVGVLHLMGEPLYAASAGYCLSRPRSE